MRRRASANAWGKSIATALLRSIAVAAVIAPVESVAQQLPPQQQPQPSNEWNKLPRMQLERQFAGPLQDTVIQRWRDPVDGVLCYIYLPITAAHTPPMASGYVQYGANGIGTISCLPPEAAERTARPAMRRPPPSRAAAPAEH